MASFLISAYLCICRSS